MKYLPKHNVLVLSMCTHVVIQSWALGPVVDVTIVLTN